MGAVFTLVSIAPFSPQAMEAAMVSEVALWIGAAITFVGFLVNLVALIVAVYKMGRAVEKFEHIGNQQATEISELKTAVSTVAKLVTEMSLQNQRLDMLEDRIGDHYKLIEGLRRGDGFILPSSVSPHQVVPR